MKREKEMLPTSLVAKDSKRVHRMSKGTSRSSHGESEIKLMGYSPSRMASSRTMPREPM